MHIYMWTHENMYMNTCMFKRIGIGTGMDIGIRIRTCLCIVIYVCVFSVQHKNHGHLCIHV